MASEVAWSDPSDTVEATWTEDVDTTSITYRDSSTNYRDNLLNYRGFNPSLEFINQTLWSILTAAVTATWQKNPAFFMGVILYEDADTLYESAIFYEDYDPSTIDENNDITRQADWDDITDTVESGWTEA